MCPDRKFYRKNEKVSPTKMLRGWGKEEQEAKKNKNGDRHTQTRGLTD